MFVQFPRKGCYRGAIFRVPPVADFTVLVGAVPQLSEPLVSLKNFTLPVTLTCSPRGIEVL